MVKIYPNAEFNADFPDDAEFDEEGEVVIAPGRNAAAAIATLFEQAGYKCSGPTADENRWGYHVETEGRASMWFGLSTFEDDEYYLDARDASFLDKFFPSAKRKYLKYIRILGDLLSGDPRFRNLRWFAEKDINHKNPFGASIKDD